MIDLEAIFSVPSISDEPVCATDDGREKAESHTCRLDSDDPTQGAWSDDGLRWTRKGYEWVPEWLDRCAGRNGKPKRKG